MGPPYGDACIYDGIFFFISRWKIRITGWYAVKVHHNFIRSLASNLYRFLIFFRNQNNDVYVSWHLYNMLWSCQNSHSSLYIRRLTLEGLSDVPVRTGCSWSLLEYINLFLKKSFVYKNIGIYLNFNLQYLDSSSLNNLI